MLSDQEYLVQFSSFVGPYENFCRTQLLETTHSLNQKIIFVFIENIIIVIIGKYYYFMFSCKNTYSQKPFFTHECEIRVLLFYFFKFYFISFYCKLL